MATRTKPATLVTTCPECGQSLRESITAVGRLAQRYLKLRKMTPAELARKTGRSPQSISFFLLGRQGDQIYFGRRASKRGEIPLIFQVEQVLRIPRRELAAAMTEDDLMMESIARRLNKACSTKPASDLAKRLHRHAAQSVLRTEDVA